MSDRVDELAAALRGVASGDARTRVNAWSGATVLMVRRDRVRGGFRVDAAGPPLEVLARHGFLSPRPGRPWPHRWLDGSDDDVAAQVFAILRAACGVTDDNSVRVVVARPMSVGARAAMIATLCAVFGLPLVWMIADLPPASWLMDLQAGWFEGRYYPKATYAVLVLLGAVVILPLVMLLRTVARSFGRIRPPRDGHR